MFKYSVKGAEQVRVTEELQVIKAYLSIQQLRFPGLFTAEYDFEESVLSCVMPKMMLQPLVENAVLHGLEPLGEGGRLTVGGRLTEQRVELWVEDNGAGFSEEMLEHFEALISGREVAPIDSIGLENVISRLQLLYGDRCSIVIRSAPGCGSRIAIAFPALPVRQEP